VLGAGIIILLGLRVWPGFIVCLGTNLGGKVRIRRKVMGCWEGTCGISQLPISYGSKVYGFLIGAPGKNKEYSGACYSSGWPITLPFVGTYDSYGGIENIIEDENTDLILSKFSNYKNFIELIGDVERDNVVLPGNKYVKPYGVGLFMVLEKIINDLSLVDFDYSCRTTPEKHKSDAKDAASLIAELNKFNNVSKFMINSIWMNYDNSFTRPFAKFNCAFSAPIDEFENYRNKIEEILKIEGITSKRLDSFIKGSYILNCANAIMVALRKDWGPQIGKGSQNLNYNLYKALIKSMEEVIINYKVIGRAA
jgi:hypothetical protein